MTLLRKRGLLPLLTAQIVSSLGSQMTFLALPWFVLVTTGSPTKMGIVLAAELAPIALLGIPSGALVSRLGARRTMLVGDAGRAPLMAAIPILHALGLLSFPLLLVCVALVGVFITPYFASQRVILPEIVGEDEQLVAQANAFVEAAIRLTSLLGPAAAGLLIAFVGSTNVLYIDAASFAFSFLMLRFFVPRRPTLPATDASRGLLAGVRYLLADRLLATLALTSLLLNGFGQMLVASLPVLAFHDFGESSKVAGAFFGAFGAGALLGSVIAVKVMHRFDPIRLGAFAFVGLVAPLWLLGLDLPATGVMAVLFVSSIFGPLINAPLIGVLTTRTPEALRPKVMTAVVTFALLAGPAALVVVGPLLAAIGARGVFVVVAAGESVAVALFAVVALRRRDDAPEPATSPL